MAEGKYKKEGSIPRKTDLHGNTPLILFLEGPDIFILWMSSARLVLIVVFPHSNPVGCAQGTDNTISRKIIMHDK